MQSSSRGLPDKPGRRLPGSGSNVVPMTSLPPKIAAAVGVNGSFNIASIPIPPPPQPSVPNLRSSLSASAPMQASQVIALAREAMKEALRHTDQQAGSGNDVSNELKPGLTIDLSRKNIQKLPEEVVDIIMNKLER